jgi:alkanesulfonate monooxygenase SsuD/methylene tetrahydromethanopterin reductase-like flavin-dependent oxidoreductase (luciferase family)
MTGAVVAADRRELEHRVAAVMEREGESGDVDDAIQVWRADRIVGTVDEARARLAEYAHAGVQRILLQHLVHDDLEMLELIAAEILPAAAAL